MENYTVVTNDGDQVGHVVGKVDGSLIVESGLLRKTRHAIPEAFAHVDDEEQTVCVTVSKNVIEDSPKIDGDEPDLAEVARYYGLAGGFDAPETQGYGEVEPDDPGVGDVGTAAAERGRIAIRTGEGDLDGPAEVHGRRPNAGDPAGLGASDAD